MISSQEQIENENIAKQTVAPFKREKKENAIALDGWLLRKCFETPKEHPFLLAAHTIQELTYKVLFPNGKALLPHS